MDPMDPLKVALRAFAFHFAMYIKKDDYSLSHLDEINEMEEKCINHPDLLEQIRGIVQVWIQAGKAFGK